jgi:hypothetical protein
VVEGTLSTWPGLEGFKSLTDSVGNTEFKVVTTRKFPANSQPEGPSSSTQVMRFLWRFSTIYGLETQASAAMALTLPLDNETNSVVHLPKPDPIRTSNVSASILRGFHNLRITWHLVQTHDSYHLRSRSFIGDRA